MEGIRRLSITVDSRGYSASWFTDQDISRADVWRQKAPSLSAYSVAGELHAGAVAFSSRWFQLLQTGDFKFLTAKPEQHHPPQTPYHKADSTRVFIDVPRGVQNEVKARNQIPGGITNHSYNWDSDYLSFTRDAVKGTAEQLGPTSLMAWQNRILGGCCRILCMRGRFNDTAITKTML